ncbi:hypothetical protein [Bradyrhizobium sp. LTSP857]|uniref:hypothetical protein n=1 Tax=Bradyrhizobium sp. LTSP857 TaxID=1619231 RepID=UPI0005D15625|nr:hypothetical protein [Bradyrhizobium sp. LTSP857]KJC43594.1 hypothetical protein UP06_20725 [Bradyrhizobium sp. LTSP857]
MEPAEIAAVIALIEAAAEQATKYKETRDMKLFQQHVSEKLDEIIGLNLQILGELRALRVFISVELERQFREQHVKMIQVLIQRLNAYLNDVNRHKNTGGFQQLKEETERETLFLAIPPNGGPAIFPTIYAGASLYLSLAHMLGTKRSERDSILNQLIPIFEKWAGPGAGNIPDAIAQKQGEVAMQLALANAQRGDKQINTFHSMISFKGYDGGSYEECTSEVHALTTLDPELNVQVTNVRLSDPSCHNGFDPGHYQNSVQVYVTGLVAEYRRRKAQLDALIAAQNLLNSFIGKLKAEL